MTNAMKVNVKGLDTVSAYIDTVSKPLKITAMREISEYLIGDAGHGLKQNPARVQHDKNNPYKWQSEKQRRAYFASNGFGGGIPYNRTGNLSEGWEYQESNSQWDRVKITNAVDYSVFVQGAYRQRGHIADKWRDWMDVIGTNLKGAVRQAQAEVDKLIRSHNG